MQLTANEILGAYQLGLISVEEARVELGFPSKPFLDDDKEGH